MGKATELTYERYTEPAARRQLVGTSLLLKVVR